MSQELEEMEEQQKKKLLQIAQRLNSHVIGDDLYQPNDFPELETHPEFRYEEGVLHGIQMVKMMIARSSSAKKQI